MVHGSRRKTRHAYVGGGDGGGVGGAGVGVGVGVVVVVGVGVVVGIGVDVDADVTVVLVLLVASRLCDLMVKLGKVWTDVGEALGCVCVYDLAQVRPNSRVAPPYISIA